LPSTKREMASLAAWVDLFGLPLGRPAGIPWLIYADCLFCETVHLRLQIWLLRAIGMI
jgi:hypothetical protein